MPTKPKWDIITLLVNLEYVQMLYLSLLFDIADLQIILFRINKKCLWNQYGNLQEYVSRFILMYK